MMGSRGIVLLFSALALTTGCLDLKNQVREKKLTSFSSQNVNDCNVADIKQLSQVNRRLAAAQVQVHSNFCSDTTNYDCYRRVFSPKVRNQKRIEEECGELTELGGAFCLKISTQYYDTSEAAKLSDTPSSSLELGGEYNRSEYVCHQKELRDGDLFLAVSTGDQLKDSLLAAIARCQNVAPRLSALNGEQQ